MQLSIVIPAHNEDENIAAALEGLLRLNLGISREIIAVDDGSTDRTGQVLQGFADKVRVIRHAVNRGYGAALKTGIRAAEGEYVLTFDGDGQFDPAGIPAFWRRAQEGGFGLVAGQRSLVSDGSPLSRLPFKVALKLLVFLLFGRWLKDLNCGYRIFRRAAIAKYLHLCSDLYSFSTTSTLVFLNRGYSVAFLPVAVRKRGANRSSVMNPGGIFNVLQLMLRTAMLFNPLRLFLPIGILSVAFGVVWGVRFIALGRGLSVLGLLFILFGVLTVFFGLIADQIAEMRKERFEG